MNDTQRKELLEEYLQGIAKYKLANKYHCSKQTVDKLVKDAVAKGIIPGEIVTKRNDAYYKSERRVLEAQVNYATVCDMYRKGFTYDEMKEATGMCFETIKKYVKRGQQEGDLFDKSSQERKNAVEARRRLKSGGEVRERTMCYHYAKPTLKEGETVNCTYKRSRDCVYGRRNSSEQGCRYSLVTGKCRTVGYLGAKVNPITACGCFSRVSKTNPKLNNAVEE